MFLGSLRIARKRHIPELGKYTLHHIRDPRIIWGIFSTSGISGFPGTCLEDIPHFPRAIGVSRRLGLLYLGFRVQSSGLKVCVWEIGFQVSIDARVRGPRLIEAEANQHIPNLCQGFRI